MTAKKVAIVAGVGPGNGMAFARRFSSDYSVALLARDGEKMSAASRDIPNSIGYGCDVGDPRSVDDVLARIRSDLGEADVLLFNAGGGVFKPFEQTTADDFEHAWRVNAYGAFLCAKAVLPAMRSRGEGAIIFTGATASLRGGKATAAFAPAKSAERSLAQSMARTFWPEGIHVGLLIVDGIVDIPRTRVAMADKDDDFFIDPAGVAEAAWQLAHQDRSAWSFEVETRPFREPW